MSEKLSSLILPIKNEQTGQNENKEFKIMVKETNKEPYVSRTARDGLVKIPQLVGATVAWNQLFNSDTPVIIQSVSDSAFKWASVIVGHKYLVITKPIATWQIFESKTKTNTWGVDPNYNERIVYAEGEHFIVQPTKYTYLMIRDAANTINVTSATNWQPMCIDLTQMFGTEIADYVYSLEQSVEGSGIAWLKSYGFFTKDYYAYDTGSLQSVCTSGRKITALDGTIRNYPIENVELRGLFKLDANNKLYADGDVYSSNGAVTKKFEIVTFDGSDDEGWSKYKIGSASSYAMQILVNDFKNLGSVKSNILPSVSERATWGDYDTFISYLSSPNPSNRKFVTGIRSITTVADWRTYLASHPLQVVYEIATETTETADPYINPQRSEGTEEFIDGLTRDVMIPVGNESTYYLSEVLPSAADYTDGQVAELALLKNYTRRTQRNITNDLAYLSRAVAEQNLEKYGYSIGDYFTGASGYTYFLADPNTFRGANNDYAVINQNHISIVVKTGANSKWNESNDTSTGYSGSVLHSYLSGTVLDNIKSDMIALFGGSTGLEHLLPHKLLWTTAISSWGWSAAAQYISALTEPQVYGTNVWAIDGYQTGEAWKHLELFKKFSYMEILGWLWFWLRSICSASYACNAGYGGSARVSDASIGGGVVGLILFK